MRRALRYPVRTARAFSAVAVTAAKVGWLERRCSLDELVRRLKRARPFLGPVWEPDLLAGITERLLPVLPPWGSGPCVKRSLMLLDLWSRCGLDPELHMALHERPGGGRHGHLWVAVFPKPPSPGEVIRD